MNRLLLIVAALSFILPRTALAQQDFQGSSAASVTMETRLSALEDQIRTLTGKVEQIEYAAHRLDQTVQHLQTDYDARLTKLESAPPVSAPAVKTPAVSPTEAQPDQTGEPVKGTLGDLKMQGDKVTGAVKDPRAPALPDKPADYGLTSQEQYDRAFGLLRQASYDEAEKAFKAFIDKNPKDKMLDNAKYWYGETFYVRAKFSDAAIAFADAFQQNPQGTKAPDSLLKLAMSLASLDRVPDACSTLASLKSKYPNAPSTLRSRADQERAQLKCGK